jgi:hypothetical protein
VLLCVAVFRGGTHGLLRRHRWLRIVAGSLGKSAMQALSKLIGGIFTLGTTLSGEDDAGRGYPGETGEPDQLPAHAHRRVG